jgi:hypothetical protein
MTLSDALDHDVRQKRQDKELSNDLIQEDWDQSIANLAWRTTIASDMISVSFAGSSVDKRTFRHVLAQNADAQDAKILSCLREVDFLFSKLFE